METHLVFPIAVVSSPFQDTLVSGSSIPHVADDDALISALCSDNVVDVPDSLTPLFSDDGDTFHDSHAPVTSPLDRSRPIHTWAISTLLDEA